MRRRTKNRGKENILQRISRSITFLFFVVLLQALCYFIEDVPMKHLMPFFSAYFIEMFIVASAAVFVPGRWAKTLLIALATLLGVSVIADVYCYMRLGVVFGPTIVMLMAETTSSEASEFIDTYLLQPDTLKVLGIFLAYFLIFGGISYAFRRLTEGITKKKKKILCILQLTIIATILVFAFLNVGNTFKQRKSLTSITDPGELERDYSDVYFGKRCTPLFRSIASYYVQHLTNNEVKQIEQMVEASRIDSCSHTSPNIIFVIGESYNRSHASLYGYEKPTTPVQDSLFRKGELYRFNDVISSWNMTSYSFKHMFSLHSVDQTGAWCSQTLFPALIKKAGYHVDFLTNQFAYQKDLDVHDFSGGFFLNSQRLNAAMFDCRNPQKFEFDEQLVSFYDSLECRDSKLPHFVIFHLSGQHFSYNKRYPSQYRRWKKEDYNRPDIKKQKNVRIVAMYDNATLYNDRVIGNIINRFRDKDAIVVYLPDHGEEVFDELQRFARSLWVDVTPGIARQEFRIPMIVWCSQQYRKNHPQIVSEVAASVNRPFMADDISHMLLYLAGVKCKEYDESRNLISPKFNTHRKRMIKASIDYDSLLISENKNPK